MNTDALRQAANASEAGVELHALVMEAANLIDNLQSENASYWQDLAALREQWEKDKETILHLTEERDQLRACLLIKCSFCGKSQKEIEKIIAGPNVYICDVCVELCCGILGKPATETSDEGEAP